MNEVAISPDGSRLVYASGTNPEDARLYVRPVGELEATVIRGSEGGVGPFFSPDGETVGFIHRESDTLKQVSILGGPAVTITSVDSFPRGVTWGPDDTVVFATSRSLGLLQVPAGGGEAEQLTSVADGEGEVAHWWPSFLPNGRAVLFTAWSGTSATSRIAVLNLESREITYLVSGGSHPQYVATGHIVYGVDGTLRAVGFDPESLTLTGGNPRPVVEGVLIRDSGAANYLVAEDGTLVYVSGSAAGIGPEGALVWLDGTGQAERIDLPPDIYRSVAMSPDGVRLALEIGQVAQAGSVTNVADVSGTDVWTYDLERGSLSKITTDPADDSSPLWTPDGRQIVFASNRGGVMGLYRRSADGSGSDEPIYLDEEAQDMAPLAWAEDGDVLVVGRRIRNQNDVMRLAMNGEGTLEPIFDSDFSEERADISPGGDWIAYASARSDQMEIYVERFPELGERETVSFDGGVMPHWSPDGRALYFLEPDSGRLMVVDVTLEGSFDAGRPRVFAEGPFDSFRYRRRYDVAPDGERLVAISPVLVSDEDDAHSQITVVLNWFEELRRLVPPE